jgi:acetolactate synthase I/II/III large subunit
VTYSGGDAVLDALGSLGVETVFGIVSVHNTPIFDAVARRGGLDIVCVRHEQAAAHAADGYSRATGRLGVVLASTGPGTTNTMTGLYEAAFASSRVLLVTGQVQTRMLGRGKAFLHEAERQAEMLRTLCRRVESPRRPDDVVPAIYRAAKDVLSGRPQPCAVEIPIDLQHGEVPRHDSHTPSEGGAYPAHPAGRPVEPSEDDLHAARELLARSSRRAIWAGGGVIRAGASPALVALAEALEAPVLTTVNGRGAIPEDHPSSMGAFTTEQSVRAILASAEVVIAVDEQGRPEVELDYRLRLRNGLDSPAGRSASSLFIQNGELHTHGVGAPDLGLGAHRNAVIANTLAGRTVYPVRERTVFQRFGPSGLNLT